MTDLLVKVVYTDLMDLEETRGPLTEAVEYQIGILGYIAPPL